MYQEFKTNRFSLPALLSFTLTLFLIVYLLIKNTALYSAGTYVASLAAILLAVVSLMQIRRNPGLRGKAFSLVALIINAICLVVMVAFVFRPA